MKKINELDKNKYIDEEDISSGETITNPFSPSDIRLTTPPMNLGDLIDMIEHDWINFGTDYQREENLWSPVQQSRLIESVLLGLRLPAFYFEEISRRRWNVIDGLQRCCAIRNFCVDNSFVLCDLEFLGDKFNGKKFNELPFDIKRDIRMIPITVNLLDAGVPEMVKYILFKRLNTGGITLKPQEIRNAVYSGKAIDLVKEMSRMDEFLKATRYKIKPKRKEDMDFVSRFIAFYVNDWKMYEPDLESHINKSMLFLNQDASPEYCMQMKKDFRASMSMCFVIFGNRAFGKQKSDNERGKPMNKAYFEVLSSVFAKLDMETRSKIIDNSSLLKDNLQKAMRESKSYYASFSNGTGSRDSVKRRFSWVNAIISATLSNKKIQIKDDYTIEY